ncbi:MAG: GTPase [Euryarchaeota archaeon]|nr:GTPase [Euryarchaeota archaeon]|tara:strand:+ start:256 stop:1158 length:903 start_codon:yes stop_codon:yes gene_type:complete
MKLCYWSKKIEIRCVLARVMAANDGTTPPVLFVVGTAGAGKSSLVTSFQRWARFLDVDVLAINLDPGAERVHYDPEFDVRDLISLSEVMDEYDLGPNGAQILAADLVASQAEDVFEQIEGLSGDMIIVDTPGQVELFAFREASNHLVDVLGQGHSCLIFLFDPLLSSSPSGFVSQMLLSSIVHFRLGLPTANFLSKSDLLDPETLERILEWGENLDILEVALYEESGSQSKFGNSGGQRAEFAIGQLRMMQHAAIQPGLIPISSELEEGQADVLSFAQNVFGGMSDAKDGFAGDIEHERH